MIGRALRTKMRDTDTPERIAERIHHRAICEQAHREMLSRFGALTVDNAVEAIRWLAVACGTRTGRKVPHDQPAPASAAAGPGRRGP